MLSLEYEEVFSRFYSKVEAYDFLDITETQVMEFLCNYLHSAVANPYVRKLFSSISLDDDIQEISYEMKYVVDTETDRDFIIEVLSDGLVINWLNPKVKSLKTINQTYGTSELKYYSEASHMSELKGLLHDSKKNQRDMIRDRGYAWNSYLDGGQ